MAAPGTYMNPADKACWNWCSSCSRCQDKGKFAKCVTCSGIYDPNGTIDPDLDNYCDCKNGVLRWKTQQGKRVMVRFKSNPFKGKVTYEKRDQDEADWDSYVRDMRERLDNPNWNPITITD